MNMLVVVFLILMVCALVNVVATVSCGFNGFPIKPRTGCEVAVLFTNVALCFALVFTLLTMGTSDGGVGGI